MTNNNRKRGMISAYFRTWKNIFNYTGRATRYEFLSFAFIHILLLIITRFTPLYGLLNIGGFIAFPALCVRRFHDQGKSGKFVCLPYLSAIVAGCLIATTKMPTNIGWSIMSIPVVLLVIMWILLLARGSDDNNKFGDKIVFDEDLAKEKKPSDLAIIAFLCLLSTNAMAENVQEVSIVKISDGDTIRAMVDGKNESIRLLDIDCFETSKNKRAVWQSEYYHLPMGKVLQNGMFSKDKLTDLLKNQKTITLKWSKRDKYKRILGHLFLPDGTNINQYMLEQGGCVEYIDRHK